MWLILRNKSSKREKYYRDSVMTNTYKRGSFKKDFISTCNLQKISNKTELILELVFDIKVNYLTNFHQWALNFMDP